jgi:hypothetical protein
VSYVKIKSISEILTDNFVIFVVLWRFERGVVVEQIGDKGHVELFVPIGDITWRDKSATAEPIRLAQHQLRAVQIRPGLKSVTLKRNFSRKAALAIPESPSFRGFFTTYGNIGEQFRVELVRLDLTQKLKIGFRVFNVGTEVCDWFRIASASQVVIHPTKQQLLRTQSIQIRKLFAIHQKRLQVRVERQIDVGEEAHSDNLPQDAQDQVRPSFQQIARANVDDCAADGGGGIERQIQVFLLAVDVELCFVDGALVDRLLLRQVDHFAQEDAIVDGGEEGFVVDLDGEEALAVGIVL